MRVLENLWITWQQKVINIFTISRDISLIQKKGKLLLRKGVYPYEWMDHADKMEYTSLPEKEAFDSKLSVSSISDDDYTHAKNVWKTFHMQTMGDHHDLYLKTDVLLLADVFENFRKKRLEYYALDPAHYYTAPG